MEDTRAAIEVLNVSRAFGAVQALDRVDLRVRRGTVHALIGRNGSGKSTLIKILAGYHRADEGELWVDGEPYLPRVGDPGARIAFVHQDLGLIERFTVLENLSLGRAYAMRAGSIDWSAEREKARHALGRFGMTGRLDEPLATLHRGEATVIAMARALQLHDDSPNVALVLDEPTSSLPHRDAGVLFDSIRAVASEGTGVVLVTHLLNEVFEVADEVTVLRDGQVLASRPVAELTERSLVHLLTGQSDSKRSALARPTLRPAGPAAEPNAPVVSARGVSTATLRDVNLDLFGGELVAIVGLLGSGVEELGLILSGREEPDAGEVRVNGRPIGGRGSRRIGLVPADRLRSGIIAALSVRENVSLASLDALVRRGRIDVNGERRLTRTWIERMSVHPPDCAERPVLHLSGGNQQKVVLGRWLSQPLDALIAEAPTRGIDARSKVEILAELRQAVEKGLAVAVLSYEFEEVIEACDRLLVLHEGAVVREMHGDDASHASVLAAMG